MQVEALKLFCDAVRLQSFTRAAEENHVTQSTISQTIQLLEKHLGVVLIDRSLRPWKITAQGKIYYDGCKQLLERNDELERKVKGHADKMGSVVKLACIYSVGLRHMNYYCEKFAKQYPESRINLEYMHPNRILESILSEEIDFGILSFPQATRHVNVIPWQSESMVLACHPNHLFAKRKEIDLPKITNEKFVAFNKELIIRKEVDRFLKLHNTFVDVTLEFDNIEAIKRAIEAGSGISILPSPTLEREVKEGTLAEVAIRPKGFKRPLGIVHLRGKLFNSNMKQFLKLFKENEDIST
jgi:DNA-binding transcriptional LysR family regulator